MGLVRNLAFGNTLEQKFSAGKNDKMTLSAVYDDECTRFTMSFQNQYKDIAGFEPIRTLALGPV